MLGGYRKILPLPFFSPSAAQRSFCQTHSHCSHFFGGISIHFPHTTRRKLTEGVLDADRLDRTRFREFLHNSFEMTDDILLDRVFKRFDQVTSEYI